VSKLALHASPGCLFQSLTVTRIQDGSETLIRRQPTVGTSDALAYDYEPRYGMPAAYRMSGVEKQNSLSSSWAGKADSSASALSENGAVIATNSFTAPNATIRYDMLNCTALSVDGKWKYTSNAADISAVYSIIPSSLPVGTVIYYKLSADTTIRTTLQNASLLRRNDDGERWWTIDSEGDHAVFIVGNDSGGSGIGQSITLERFGQYTPSDYAAMQSLGIGWFSGDTYQVGVTSTFDILSSEVTLSPDTGWLIHPGNPAKSMPLPLGRLTGLTGLGRGMNATRHDVLGATLPVYTITGPRFGLQFTLELRTRSLDEESILWALLDDQIPVLINWLNTDSQRLNMKPMYLQIGDVGVERFAQMLYPKQIGDTPGDWREWKLPCIQVQSPAISQQAVGWTYAALLAEQSTYLTVQASYATFADLQAHNSKDGG
jgi:hypothetical protein